MHSYSPAEPRAAAASVTLFVLLLSLSCSAGAQSSLLEEVVVTAQKRSQDLQDVPLAITAFTGETAERLHLREFTDIFLYTPGLVSTPNYAYSERTAIRGLGSAAYTFGFDPHVGVFVNGVYQGRNGAQTSSMFDVERVEVVKGPVGALYGRSAIAGAINIINNVPSRELEGKVDAGFGERNRMHGTGVLNVPLADGFSMRLGVHTESEDGFITNNVDGKTLGDNDATAARAAIRFANDVLDAKLTFNYEDRTDVPNIYQPTSGLETPYFGFPLSDYVLTEADPALIGPFSDRYRVATDLKPNSTQKTEDVVADFTFDFGGLLSLQSLTSYRTVENRYLEDFDGNAIPDLTYFGPFEQNADQKLFQQEFQFNYTPANGSVWIFGASYYDENVAGFIGSSYSETLNLFSSPVTQIQDEFGETDGDFSGWSTYADATLELTESFELTLGARYSRDEKELIQYVPDPSDQSIFPNNTDAAIPFNWPASASSPVTSRADWSDVTFRAAFNYAISEKANVYVSWAQGYKAGAIDALSFEAPVPFDAFSGVDVSLIGGQPAVADPESSDSYEIGYKAQFLDRRVRANAALFYYEFEDQQQLVAQGPTLIVKNVGRVVGQGAEVELNMLPFERWEVAVNVAYLDTEIKEDEFAPENVGQPTPRAPEWSGSAIATYTYPLSSGGSVFASASYSFQSEMRTGTATTPSYDLTNASFGFDSRNNWGASVYVENLADEFIYFSGGIADGTGNTLFNYRNNIYQPRTFGAEIYYNF